MGEKKWVGWFGHIEGKKSEVKSEDKKKDRVKEYMHESVADGGKKIEHARRACMDRERWRLFIQGHSSNGEMKSHFYFIFIPVSVLPVRTWCRPFQVP